MTITELIAQLERVRAEHGADLPVVIRIDDFFGDTGEVTDVDFVSGANGHYTSGAVRLDAY